MKIVTMWNQMFYCWNKNAQIRNKTRPIVLVTKQKQQDSGNEHSWFTSVMFILIAIADVHEYV